MEKYLWVNEFFSVYVYVHTPPLKFEDAVNSMKFVFFSDAIRD